MSYFDEVFLKRMNKDGNNRQDRIKRRKEREFDRLYLKRTENSGIITSVNQEEYNQECSLQPNNWNESKIISNLLISTHAAALQVGDILTIYQKKGDDIDERIWLILFKEKNITKGYQLYKLICLDSVINITNEYGTTLYSIPVKFVNAVTTFSVDKVITTGLGYSEPNDTRAFITSNFDFLTKGTYFNYAEKGWEISGSDNGISVPNVCYCYIGERLKTEEEPRSSEDILVGAEDNFFLNNR